MPSDFRPLHIEHAKQKLSEALNEAEVRFSEEKKHYRELRKKRASLWYKFLRIFKK